MPVSKPFPHWIGLIQLFDPSVWYASLFTYIFACVSVWTLGKFATSEYKIFVEPYDIVLTIARMMIGNSPSLCPRTIRLQIVIVLWSIFCLNWFSAYTTSLIAKITGPLYGEHVIAGFLNKKSENCSLTKPQCIPLYL